MGLTQSVAQHPLPPLEPDSILLKDEWTSAVKYLESIDGPLPAKYEERWQWEMAHAHVLLLQMLERTYMYGPYAEKINDLGNYLGYAEVTFFQVYKHHELEDTITYPSWTEATGKDFWSGNSAEHHQFDKELMAGWIYIRSCRERLGLHSPVPAPPPAVYTQEDIVSASTTLDSSMPFSVTALQQHMDTFLPVLATHLSDEITTLHPENMAYIPEKKFWAIQERIQNHLMQYGPEWFLCSAFSGLSVSVLKELIPLPWFVRRLLMPYWFAPKYWGFWKYSPHPENLTFWGSA